MLITETAQYFHLKIADFLTIVDKMDIFHLEWCRGVVLKVGSVKHSQRVPDFFLFVCFITMVELTISRYLKYSTTQGRTKVNSDLWKFQE